VQGELERALLKITGEKRKIIGASRTDAGVHAIQQVAAFNTESSIDPTTFVRAFNANLPSDIRVLSGSYTSDRFHPRYSARSKTYTYVITREGEHSVFLRRFSWPIRYRLDIEAMKEAAGYLLGRHDFSSFRASGCTAKNPVREIMDINIRYEDRLSFMNFSFSVPSLIISIKANAFLRHMARNIIGTLVDIGRGRFPQRHMIEILNARDRSFAGITAPACGLFLERIEY
jgi:tRNA pseudouridine38-40 synthase